MRTERATVCIPQGIHAAIAHRLHREAGRFQSSLFLKHGARTASLGSIIAILALGVERGAEIEILADGSDESAALVAIVGLLDELAT
ncbi:MULTISPECIES: HPr family phosphocarrier protein [Cryobacterium]|uniref:HPr family phosphocarrier protein n=1 Tax=Cryobacterium glucosi TaxID=1259175 RepID=A0ABY2IPB0_9MICO|nr:MULTISPECIES: HPr family phosphocarrier protein [Cryobacterium]TFB95310.1 HPr family phosphocarrier protein [Cryobacterium sp. MDB2-A-1]TFC11345.1 HPr family phosphocarrier protein [Cryobacterium sp. MDB2-A-2]TFC11642.1 HPr family phosphocarrier protein [Cryobacterium sp. MDB2-33-2]TFC18893.1 HPr family phosphocarrier protein [Cryobacterium sp. MDB2-10]TFC21636.1 HPr family phosphocarrier protein [Cryobacterium glucosi]